MATPEGPRCPMCYAPLEVTGRTVGTDIHCTGCGHLWRIADDGSVVATNATGHIVSADTAARVARGPLTARKAHPFVEKEVG